MNGAEILVSSLEKQGVKDIFGIPGNHVLSVYDTLTDSKIRSILGAHEPGIGFMADGYGRVSQTPGVALVTAGPGVLNIVNPVAQAYVESSPMVVIGSHCNLDCVGKGNYHELESSESQLNIFKQITKWSVQVKDASEIGETINKAFLLASSGRKRPVYVEIPENLFLLDSKLKEDKNPKQESSAVNQSQIKEAIALIKSARSPVLFVGGGVLSSGSSKELLKFAEIMQIPIATTAMAKNAVSETNPLSLGCGIGLVGSHIAKEIIGKSDLMIAIGTRFDEVGTGFFTLKVPEKLIHIDIDIGEFGRNYRADLTIHGDAKVVLDGLIKECKNLPARVHKQQDVIRQLKTEELNNLKSQLSENQSKVNPLEAIDAVIRFSDNDSILIADAGNSSLWLLDYPMNGCQRVITPASYNSMGFAIPAAIGAKIAKPYKGVVAICGDGSFAMTGMELMTAVRYNLDLTVIVLHDKKYNILCLFQDLKHGRRHKDTSLSTMDFKLFAESVGAFGQVAKTSNEVYDCIGKAIAHKGPSLVEVCVDETKLPGISKRIQRLLRS